MLSIFAGLFHALLQTRPDDFLLNFTLEFVKLLLDSIFAHVMPLLPRLRPLLSVLHLLGLIRKPSIPSFFFLQMNIVVPPTLFVHNFACH